MEKMDNLHAEIATFLQQRLNVRQFIEPGCSFDELELTADAQTTLLEFIKVKYRVEITLDTVQKCKILYNLYGLILQPSSRPFLQPNHRTVSKSETKQIQTMQTLDTHLEPGKDDISIILPNFLFLSGISGAESRLSLLRLGVKVVLNCAMECKNNFEEDFHYVKLFLRDREEEQIWKYFSEAFKVIERAREDNKPILIHCMAGMSRSVTGLQSFEGFLSELTYNEVTIAYLMRFHKMTLLDAVSHVKQVRSFIRPNVGYMRQLMEAEQVCPSLLVVADLFLKKWFKQQSFTWQDYYKLLVESNSSLSDLHSVSPTYYSAPE